nr:hypothetical protein [Tanacetum cinerariifolium]
MAFQVTADVPEIYMQEFRASAKLHHNSIRFKIDTRKSVLDLEAFREMLHISLGIPNQPFADLPTEEEVLDFLRFLGHGHDIHYLTDAKAWELAVSDCLKLNCFGDSITESTLTLPILSGRTLCIRTMATTIEQQVALDEAFIPSTKRLRIGRSNFRLLSDIQSKESTLQVVYDVLRRSPFFKAFLVTADVPEIYMQEFWATTYVHQHSSDSKWTPERTLSIWKHIGRCCILVLGFWTNLLMSYRLKRRSWIFFGFLDIMLR